MNMLMKGPYIAGAELGIYVCVAPNSTDGKKAVVLHDTHEEVSDDEQDDFSSVGSLGPTETE